MKKIGFFAFLPIGFAAIATMASASPISDSTHTQANGYTIDAYVVKTEVEASGNVYLTLTGDPDLESGTANAPVYHCDDANVNYLDNVIISTGGVDYVLRDIITSDTPSYNKFTRQKSFYFTIDPTVAAAYMENRTGGQFSNTSHITIKEGFTIPAYSYGSVEDATGKTPTYLRTKATSVFSDPRDKGVSVVYKVDEDIDLTYCEEQTDSGRIANYRSYATLPDGAPVTGIIFGSDQTKTPRVREDGNANVETNGLINGILNGHKIKINGKCIAGERDDRTTDKHSYLNIDYWARWWQYELFVNGGEEGGVQTIEVKEGTVFPCYKTKSIGSYVMETDTVETIESKTRLVYRVKEDTKFVKNSKGVFIRDHGEDYETTIKDAKVKFVPWDNGTRFLMLNLTNSDYKDFVLANQGIDKTLADKYDFVNHIKYYTEDGTLVPHNGSANDSLINFDFGGGNKPDIGIRVKQDGVTDDPFTGVKYIKFEAGMQFPAYCYMGLYTNDPMDPIPAPEFYWSRPDMTAYTLKDDIVFYNTGINNEFVRLVDHVTDIEESEIPASDLIHNVGKWKPDHSGHAVKNFDQTPETLHWIEGNPAAKTDTYGLYFSNTPKDPFVANSASEVRFYLPDNGYKSETKQYVVKSWSFDYRLTDINSVKGTEDGSSFVATDYKSENPVVTKPASTTTSYMLQYIADSVLEPGTLAYYCYDVDLIADGEWHTCTINQYCPTVYGLNIKLFKFVGEFAVANVKCELDTHAEKLELVPGQEETCSEAGYKDCYRCSLCGKYFEDQAASIEIADYEAWKTGAGKIDPHAHTLEYHAGKTPTCTEDGNIEYWECTECGKFFKDPDGSIETTWEEIKVPATGHTLEHHDAVEPTCETSGNLEYWECTKCGEYFLSEAATEAVTWDDIYLDPLGHDLIQVSEGKEPTCSEPGFRPYLQCTICKDYFYYTEEGDIEKIGNEEALVVWKSVGGKGYLEPIGHDLVIVEGKKPTCSEAGYKDAWKCTECGLYYADNGAKELIGDETAYFSWKNTQGEGYISPTFKHDYILVEGKAPTCSEAGYKEAYQCKECGDYFEKTDNAYMEIGDYNAYVKWTQEGGRGYLAPTGEHHLVKVDGKAATCETSGYKEYYKCENCNLYYEDAEGTKLIGDFDALNVWLSKGHDGYIAPKGHNLEFVAEVAATTEKEGIKEHYVCKDCGKLFIKDGETYRLVSMEDLIIPKKTGGCGGSIMATSAIVATAALAGATLLIAKKKREE